MKKFPLRIYNEDIVKELEKIAKETNQSVNRLINIAVIEKIAKISHFKTQNDFNEELYYKSSNKAYNGTGE